ncbi:hypothetical protein GCM10027348_16820 [Hymenobacter tenuis]
MGQHIPLAVAAALWLYWQPLPAKTERKLAAQLPSKAGATLPKAAVPSFTVRGMVEAGRVVPLITPAHGWVRQVYFEEGEYVRKRQILLKFLESSSSSNQVNRAYFLAPYAGFVVQKKVVVGGHLKAGTCLATLHDVSHVKVVLAVSPEVARQLKVCDPVAVRIAEYPARRFSGIIEQIQPQPAAHGTQRLTVLVRNHTTPLIRPQMHASVQLPALLAGALSQR